MKIHATNDLILILYMYIYKDTFISLSSKASFTQLPHHPSSSHQTMETETLLPNPEYSSGIEANRRWRPRRYWRLGGGPVQAGKKPRKMIRLRGRSSRRYWRMKAIPRVRLSWVVRSPLKLLRKLKNAYIDLMLRVAGKAGSLGGDNVFGQKRIPKARQVTDRFSIDAFEARLIYEISKVLVASRELNPT